MANDDTDDIPVLEPHEVYYEMGKVINFGSKESETYVFIMSIRKKEFERCPWATRRIFKEFRREKAGEIWVVVCATQDEWNNPHKYENPTAKEKPPKVLREPGYVKRTYRRRNIQPEPAPPNPDSISSSTDPINKAVNVSSALPPEALGDSLPEEKRFVRNIFINEEFNISVDVIGEVVICRYLEKGRRCLTTGNYSARKVDMGEGGTWIMLRDADGFEYGLPFRSWARYFQKEDHPTGTVKIEGFP